MKSFGKPQHMTASVSGPDIKTFWISIIQRHAYVGVMNNCVNVIQFDSGNSNRNSTRRLCLLEALAVQR